MNNQIDPNTPVSLNLTAAQVFEIANILAEHPFKQVAGHIAMLQAGLQTASVGGQMDSPV